VFKPSKEFHTSRHTMYSAEENMEIDKVVQFAASVKTNLGRGGLVRSDLAVNGRSKVWISST